MLDLLKKKIEEVTELDELNKVINIAFFIIKQDSLSVSPLQPEYMKAFEGIASINDTDFSQRKEQLLNVVNELIKDKDAIESTENVNKLMYSTRRYNQRNELEYALLMIEQNNMDFFGGRESHLPTQPHDRLFSHIITQIDGNSATVSFLANSELPESIQQQVIKAIKDLPQE